MNSKRSTTKTVQLLAIPLVVFHPISDRVATYTFRHSTVQRLYGIADDLQGQVSSVLNALKPKQRKVDNGDDDYDDGLAGPSKSPEPIYGPPGTKLNARGVASYHQCDNQPLCYICQKT